MTKNHDIPGRVYFGKLAICFEKPDSGETGCLPLIVKNSAELEKCVMDYLTGTYPQDIQLLGYPAEQLYNDFRTLFKNILAAGGLVRNNAGAYLFIERFGIWDLPKGKVHHDETTETGALREVREETGLQFPVIEQKLLSTFHIYRLKEDFILKETTWYLMNAPTQEKLVPQTEEDVTRAVWLDRKQAAKAISGSYRSLSESLAELFSD